MIYHANANQKEAGESISNQADFRKKTVLPEIKRYIL